MLQPVTPPPTITTCARLGTVPLVVPGSIATVYLPGPPDESNQSMTRPAGPAWGGPGGRDRGPGPCERLAACTWGQAPSPAGRGAAIRDRRGRPAARGTDEAQIRGAKQAVYIAFIANGFIFASWAARIPQVRDGLRVSPGVLGLILLCTAVGSTIATPLSGLVITWLGDSRTVVVMSL